MTGPAPERPTLIILAGGKGLRLRALDSRVPKPMIEVGGKPFLHWLVAHYRSLGFRDFVMSTGYLAEAIESYDWTGSFRGGLFRMVRESQPLGTGGAVRAIFSELGLERAWVVNGDTLLPAPLPLPPAQAEAAYTALKASELFDAKPNLWIKANLVVAEKPDGQYFDGGAIFVTRHALERYQGSVPCSIHQLLEPAMLANKVHCLIVEGTCYDIGTPERYKRFESYLESPECCKD